MNNISIFNQAKLKNIFLLLFFFSFFSFFFFAVSLNAFFCFGRNHRLVSVFHHLHFGYTNHHDLHLAFGPFPQLIYQTQTIRGYHAPLAWRGSDLRKHITKYLNRHDRPTNRGDDKTNPRELDSCFCVVALLRTTW